MTRLTIIGIASLAILPICAQQCEAPSDVKAAIDAASKSPVRPSPDERIAAARKLREQFPSDYFAHRFYQEQSSSQGLFSKAVQEEYRTLLETHPDDLLYLLLHARTLVGTNTPEALKLLDKILVRDPNYPQARLKLVEIHSAPAFRDNQKITVNAEAYWKVCPDSLSAYTQASRVEDVEFNARAAARLRKLLEGRTDDEALRLYNTLWTMEFKGVPLSEQDPVRERVRKDAEFLRSQDVTKHGFLLNELAQAYKLTSDAEGTKWADAEMARHGTPGMSAASQAINEWHRSNPFKSGSERDAYQEKQLKRADEWIRQWPDDPQPRYERFSTLQSMRDASLEDTVAAAEDWIRVYESRPSFMAPYLNVAQFYSRHNMRYAELPDLLEKALKKMPPTQPVSPASDLYLPNQQGQMTQFSNWTTLSSIAGIYLKLKKYDRARELLAQVGPPLLKAKPSDTASDMEKRQYGSTEYMYWSNMATLARADGNKLDVLNYERNSYLANPFHNPGSDEYQVRSLRDLWKEVKGSDEGFEAWLGKPIPAAKAPTVAVAVPTRGWAKMDKPLPDFRISDADGKSWQLADLRGKVTLVNLWATWCGPCREELPYLQKLFNKVRERKDLVVITLNTDDNPGMIGPFLKENKYTFPVLPASAYVSKLVPELSIPRNWIVDSKGVARLELIGFGGAGDKWVDDMIAEMEKAK